MIRTIVAGVILMVMIIALVRHLESVGRVPAASAPVKTDLAPLAATSRSLAIRASPGGHFEVDARVDGRRIAFLVDTGASQITLRESEAARLGFHLSLRDYSIRLITANGEGKAALVNLRSVEVATIAVHDLQALVVTDDLLPVNLLGMSFLSRVRWSYERGDLILEQ